MAGPYDKPEKKAPRENDLHDFFYDRPFLFNLVGYGPSTGPLYIARRVTWYTLNVLWQSMAWYALYLSAPKKDLMINALHFQLLSSFGLWGLSTRLLTYRSLSEARDMIRRGLYTYIGEETDEEEARLREGISGEIRRRSNFSLLVYTIGASTNMVLFPISQIFLLTEEPEEDFVNPYLPHLFYVPFDTRNFLGYTAAYLLDTLLLVYVYGMAVSMNETYLSCVVHLKTHLKILNHSISNIQRRAYSLYLRDNNSPAQLAMDDLTDNAQFQACLYSCLKANIKHHQTLLIFKKQCTPAVGSYILDTMILATLIYATVLYLIMLNPPLNIAANDIMTLVAEQTYAFCLCVFGEEIIEQSTMLFENLYNMSWMHYNQKFKQTLHIMMSNTIKPLKMQALLLDYNASLESYGDLLTAMYKIMNLVRQSDKL